MGVSPLWKAEFLDCCINAVWAHCKKGGLFGLDVDKGYYIGMCFSDR